jgi:hypothetical protein
MRIVIYEKLYILILKRGNHAAASHLRNTKMALSSKTLAAAAKFADIAGLQKKRMKKDATTLKAFKKDFVAACVFVATEYDTYLATYTTKSGLSKPQARKAWLLAAMGLDKEPSDDFISDMRAIGNYPDIAARIAEEKDISGVQYFRKLVSAAKPAANAEASEASESEADAVIDPAARLTKLAAELVDYAAKNGVDMETLHTLLDKVAGNTTTAAAAAE